MSDRFDSGRLRRIVSAVETIRDRALEAEAAHAEDVALAVPDHRPSARNLLHYLSLRQEDVRDLQLELSRLGLSSLGRTEAHVIAGLEAVLAALRKIADVAPLPPADAPVDHDSGPALLGRHTEALLGPAPADRDVRIMVTMPSEAATDPALVRTFLDAGMDVMRINCAHDDRAAWEGMARNLEAAPGGARRCRILADLAGPKLRTGRIRTVERALRVKPPRGPTGAATGPAIVRLAPAEAPPPAAPATPDAARLPVTGPLAACRPGDELAFRDARGRRRRLTVLRREDAGAVLAECRAGAWFVSGTPLALRRDGEEAGSLAVAALPRGEEEIRLAVGESIVLGNGSEEGRAAPRDPSGVALGPATIPCTLPEIFSDVRAGERIFFDDGKIGGVIESVSGGSLVAKITHARAGGARLGSDKGINLPDSDLRLGGLTEKDRDDLEFAVRHADMVGLSFVRRPEDLLRLEEELDRLGAQRLGIVVKIETRSAFENLPRLLSTGFRSPPFGVMVARGDLAVELGFERLAEVQEEILWLCEAAHVPVIWATQVLESLAKKGLPSRAEVTDAAMAGRAECVMLNKGPHVAEAVRFLADVLRRMRQHQSKKRSMLRRLSVSGPAPPRG